MLTVLLPQAAQAVTQPATVLPPVNLGVANHMGNDATVTMSAPDDLRTLIDEYLAAGGGMKLLSQVDFKIDNGDWHYTPVWDDPKAGAKYMHNSYNVLSGGKWQQFLGHINLAFNTMFPEEKNAPPHRAFDSYNWYKSHFITFRARFVLDFGKNNVLYSGWSSEYVLSDKVKMDYKKVLNANTPALVSSKLEQDAGNKRPYIWINLDRHPADTEKFNAAAGDSMRTEVWMRKSGDKDFKLVGDSFFGQEKIYLDVSSYYKDSKITDYAAAAYDVKVRYKIDERAYQQSGATALNWLYSPYSNTLSYGMPAWSAASKWATGELEKADEYGLIPDILKGADLTKPITREEFAAMAVLLYEKTTGKKASAADPNPFTDTKDQDTLKAYALGITTGVTPTTFAPKELINREQIATMLSRAIRVMVPGEDFSTAGAPTFSDQKDISSWALEHAKFISKIEVIKGTNGKFMPKATTTAQKAAGYATATREQSLAMGVRIYEKYK
jgi:hypothetical protein